jgi:tyrosinase
MTAQPRVRRSIDDLQYEYENGNKKPLEDVMRAWAGIKALPPDDPNSFFMIGGYHGEPFRGGGWGNSSYWGGYCNHGNVLFPTWHRAYLVRLEDALRSIEGCGEVTLPFWDETSQSSLSNGVPWALTVETFELDGKTITNPLRSFVFNKTINDHISGDNPNYSKPAGYETVRYPLSGLVGTEADRAKTKAHNDQYPNYNRNVGLLNANIVDWLTSYIEVEQIVNGKKETVRYDTNVAKKYADCLNAPNYTVFSNTSSANEWNDNLLPGAAQVVPVESPHNSIHLAVGGYDVPTGPNAGDFSSIDGANGDMGENDTAGLDPIFFFHHCFVDRVFWLWQKRHGATDNLDIISQHPGTNSIDNQGPTPGVFPNSWLTMDSPLDPFRKLDATAYTSRDCFNIETQLGYTYGRGSLEDQAAMPMAAASAVPVQRVHVAGINRGAIRGSFLVSAFAEIDGRMQHIGTEAVLSRWHVEGCANCQTHLEVRADIHVPVAAPRAAAGLAASAVANIGSIKVEVRTRDGLLGQQPMLVAAASPAPKKPFRFELR